MKTPKLKQLLSAIHPKELHWLSKWVRSPFYNTNQDVVRLFEIFRREMPDWDSPLLTKEALSKQLFPGKPYDDGKIRQLLFRLSELVEAFLVAQNLKTDRFQYQQLLHAELGKRNLYDLYAHKNKELMEILDKHPLRDSNHYLAHWQLQHDYFLHPRTSRYQIPTARLEEVMQSLDAFFVLSKMSYAAELLNRQNLLSEKFDISLLEESRQWAAEHPEFSQNKVFQIHRDVLHLMEQPEHEQVYLQLEESITTHLALFHPTDQSALLRYLINTTIKLHNKGKPGYLRKQLSLYQLGLEKELFLIEGRLSDVTFLNIIVTATILKELVWVEGFITSFTDVLPSQKQEHARDLGMAYVHTAQGDFLTSNALLRQIDSPDLQYLLRNRSLTLRNHFEMYLQDESYYEVVEYESRAFEKFLKRNHQLSPGRVKAYLNLTSFLRKIASYKTNLQLTPAHLEQLREELETEKTVVARQWLLEKVRDLGSEK